MDTAMQVTQSLTLPWDQTWRQRTLLEEEETIRPSRKGAASEEVEISSERCQTFEMSYGESLWSPLS